MKLFTENKNPNRIFKMEIRYLDPELFETQTGYGSHLRFLFFESGNGVVELNKNFASIISPACLMLHEKDILDLAAKEHYQIHGLYFTPSVVNSSLNFNNIRDHSQITDQSPLLDLYFLHGFLERKENYQGAVLTGPVTAGRVLELLKAINNELLSQADNFWPCRSRSYFLELLNLLNTIVQNPLEAGVVHGKDELVHAVLEYLNNHYHKKVSIQELTRFFNTNRTTLSERFVKSTGMSIGSYLGKTRIRMACLLLRDTTLPVVEVAGRTGYEDITHFGRHFKRETALSPSQYRQKNSVF